MLNYAPLLHGRYTTTIPLEQYHTTNNKNCQEVTKKYHNDSFFAFIFAVSSSFAASLLSRLRLRFFFSFFALDLSPGKQDEKLDDPSESDLILFIRFFFFFTFNSFLFSPFPSFNNDEQQKRPFPICLFACSPLI